MLILGINDIDVCNNNSKTNARNVLRRSSCVILIHVTLRFTPSLFFRTAQRFSTIKFFLYASPAPPQILTKSIVSILLEAETFKVLKAHNAALSKLASAYTKIANDKKSTKALFPPLLIIPGTNETNTGARAVIAVKYIAALLSAPTLL